MLEIFRVVMTNCDDHQHLVVGGVEQVPHGIWKHVPERCAHWTEGTSLNSLHLGAPRSGVKRIARADDGRFSVTDVWDTTQIGRASCRERGCQYVSISVVAVSLKKKRRKKNSKTQ